MYDKYIINNEEFFVRLLFIFIILILPSLSYAENLDEDRQTRIYGTGNSLTGGGVITYTDPQTGDIVTTVIPPSTNEQNSSQNNIQNFPIYVYPEITPGGRPRRQSGQ